MDAFFRTFANMEATGRPKIAIIDSNTLATLGLKQILQNVLPIMTVDTYGSFSATTLTAISIISYPWKLCCATVLSFWSADTRPSS